MYLRKSQTYWYMLDMFISCLQAVLKNKTQIEYSCCWLPSSPCFLPLQWLAATKEKEPYIGGRHHVAVAVLPHLHSLKSHTCINSLSYAQILITLGHSTLEATAYIHCWSPSNTSYETILSTHYCYTVIMPAPHASVQKAKTAPKIRPSHLGEIDHHAQESGAAKRNGTNIYKERSPASHASIIHSEEAHKASQPLPRHNNAMQDQQSTIPQHFLISENSG